MTASRAPWQAVLKNVLLARNSLRDTAGRDKNGECMFLNLFKFRPNLKYAGGSSPLRVILLAVVFVGIIGAFWANSERYTTKFSAAGRFHDEIGAFSDEQKKEIIKIISRFSKNSQVKLQVRVQKNLFTSPDAARSEVLFGVAPEYKQVVIFMPALWRGAVGEGFIHQLRGEIMAPAFDNGTWPEAAVKALLLMEHRFDALSRGH